MNADFIDINLLPRPVRPALGGNVRRYWMVPGFGLLVLSLLLLMGGWMVKVRNDKIIATQEAELTRLGKEVQSFSVLVEEVDHLQQQVVSLARQAEQLEGDAERVTLQNPSLAPFLQALTESLLPRMEITGILASRNNRFLVRGEAGSNSLVVEYANALKQRPEIGAVTLRSVERLSEDAPPGAVRWTLEVER